MKKLRNITLLISLILLSLTISVYAQADEVLNIEPGNGAEYVSLDSKIKAYFNGDRNSSDYSFTISPSLEGSISAYENAIIFTPASSLKKSTEYKVTIKNKKDDSSYSWSFTTVTSTNSNVTLTFISKELKEYNKEKKYQYKVTYPELTGYPDKNVEKYINQKIYSIVSNQIKDFKDGCNSLFPNVDGSFEWKYIIRNKTNNILSIKFDGWRTFSGVAPQPCQVALNYNLATNSVIKLSDLFQSSYYFNVINDYCNAELKKRKSWWEYRAFEEDGYEFQAFTMTSDYLIISFGKIFPGEYAQEVAIPWSKLKDILDPSGPCKYLYNF